MFSCSNPAFGLLYEINKSINQSSKRAKCMSIAEGLGSFLTCISVELVLAIYILILGLIKTQTTD